MPANHLILVIPLRSESKTDRIYPRAYGQNPQAAKLYESIKTMETHRKTIGKHSTLILSTDSEIYKFLKSSNAAATLRSRERRDSR